MPVAGEGPQPSLGMIVGSAPGTEEEKAGRPMAGIALSRLKTVLRAVGMDYASVYCTNAVKERPVNAEGRTRAPNNEELMAWAAILNGELENTAPAAVLCLGQVAMEAITGIDRDLVPYGSIIGPCYLVWDPRNYLLNMGDWIKQVRPWADKILEAS